MHTEIIRTEAAWETLSGEWNDLLAESISDVPFLRYEYLRAWWQHRGGGEWPQAELCIITGRDANGTLLGIAPLFITPNNPGKPCIMLLGSVEISDYLDLIVTLPYLESFVNAVVAHMMRQDAPEWGCWDWYNVMQSSPTLAALEKAAPEHNLDFSQAVDQPAPYVMLPDNIDDYLADLDRKYRNEFRRKMRNAAGFFLPLSWHIVEEKDKLDSELEAFSTLMSQDRHKERFLTDDMRAQMGAIAHALFDSGMLQLAFLKAGNDYVAAYFNIDYRNRIWVYNSGMDYKFAQLSPGIVLAGYLLMDAIEKGREMVDFMRGDEEYKYQLGGKDKYVMHAVLKKKKA